MRKSIVKRKFKEGKPVLCVSACVQHPAVTELISLMGFDCIWMDFEHQSGSLDTAAAMVRGCRAGGDCDCMLRCTNRNYEQAKRMLELGATGILYPRAESVEEVKELVKIAKFPPAGERGFGGSGADGGYGLFSDVGRYTAWCNEQTFLLAQIENARALDLAGEIAAVGGLDGLFIGLMDLSLSLGIEPGLDNPRFVRCVDAVAKAADAAGKVWAMPAGSTDHVKLLLDKGASFIPFGGDLGLIKEGFLRIQEQVGPLGFEFSGRVFDG